MLPTKSCILYYPKNSIQRSRLKNRVHLRAIIKRDSSDLHSFLFEQDRSQNAEYSNMPINISKCIIKTTSLQQILTRTSLNRVPQEFIIRLTPLQKVSSSEPRFRFSGLLSSPLARFFPEHLTEDSIYVTGTGNSEIDQYQKEMISGYEQVHISKLKQTNKMGVIFGSYPREAIKNELYSAFYHSTLTDKVDFHYPKQSISISNTTLINKEEIDNILLTPKTWIIQKENLHETILSPRWSLENNLANLVQMNIFGTRIILRTTNKEKLLIDLKRIRRAANKDISHYYFEEIDFDEQLPDCELIIGFINE